MGGEWAVHAAQDAANGFVEPFVVVAAAVGVDLPAIAGDVAEDTERLANEIADGTVEVVTTSETRSTVRLTGQKPPRILLPTGPWALEKRRWTLSLPLFVLAGCCASYRCRAKLKSSQATSQRFGVLLNRDRVE